MPTKNGGKYYRKRRYNRRNPYRRNPNNISTVGDIAYKAWKGVKWLYGQMNAEYKHVTTELTDFVSNSGATTFVNLSGINQGTGVNQRTGNSVKWKLLRIRGDIRINAAATNPQVMRIVVIYDKLNTTGVFSDMFTDGTTFYAPFGYKQEDSKYDTVVLLDKTYSFSPNGRENYALDIKIPIERHAGFSDAATLPTAGAIKYIAISGDATNGPEYRLQSRLFYVDN